MCNFYNVQYETRNRVLWKDTVPRTYKLETVFSLIVNISVTKPSAGGCSVGYKPIRCTLISDNGNAICGFLAVRENGQYDKIVEAKGKSYRKWKMRDP